MMFWMMRLAFLEADLLVRGRHVEERVEADGGLLDARADAVERRRLEDRRVHDALVDEPLDLVQQRLAALPVALLRLLEEKVVDVGVAAVGIRRARDHEGLEPRRRVTLG